MTGNGLYHLSFCDLGDGLWNCFTHINVNRVWIDVWPLLENDFSKRQPLDLSR